MTTTLLVLHQKLSQAIQDFIEEDTTGIIGAGVTVLSTNLNKWDRAKDDRFNDWWLYITEGNNLGVEREISDYATATGTCTVRGANLAAEAGAVTVRWGRYSWAEKLISLNNASREIYPNLYRAIENHDLITGNILPNSHFQDWASSSYPDFYTTVLAAAVANTTITYIRGGAKSVKVTPTAANGYLVISASSYPQLLDLMGRTVSFKAWAYPEVANDATLVIYTLKADGTAQTLTSTTACPAGKWTLLKLEDQVLNDDLVSIQFRFNVITNAKYVYFDNARVTGRNLYEYLLPTDFQNGAVTQAFVQDEGYSDNYCDDLEPRSWSKVLGFKVISDGTYKYLQLPWLYESSRQIRLLGIAPLEELSSQTDTISLDGEKVRLLIAYAAMDLFERLEGVPASEDVGRFLSNSTKWKRKYYFLLPNLGMMMPSQHANMRVY